MNRLQESILRIREALATNPEVQRTTMLALLVLVVWTGALSLTSSAAEEKERLLLQEQRYAGFLDVVSSYRTLAARNPAGQAASASDPLAALSAVVDRLGLKDRIAQLATTGKGVTLQVDKLYAEELLTLLQELSQAGLAVESATLKVFPEGNEKLFSVTMLVGGKS